MKWTQQLGFKNSPQDLAATWGGPGFRWRQASHTQELKAGRVWHLCGYCSEVAPLREVLLSWPGEELCLAEDPDDYLMLGRVNLDTIRRQIETIRTFFASQGVPARLYRPSQLPPPNLIFMRDLFFMTPEGAILGRPASEQRAGEERFAAEALAQMGVPILCSLRGEAWFEGADALWIDPQTVIVGMGQRTNRQGLAAVSQVLQSLGVKTITVAMPSNVQHLLGMVNLVDYDLAVVDSERVSVKLKRFLRKRGLSLLELPPDEELREKRGMNFVTLAPRQLVMPARCPGIRRRFDAAGIQTHEIDVGEYLLAGGGLACLTGIVARED